MATPNLVCVGIKGSVVALDRNSGGRIWETKLKGGSFVTLMVDGDRLLAGAQGEIFCLDANTGRLLWHDALKGYGLGLMSIATCRGNADVSALAAEHQRQQDSDASGAAAASV